MSIVVRLQMEGTHSWPGVVDHPDLEEVHFLQYPHRHIFHIELRKRVEHDDRDVEIIAFKRLVESRLAKWYPQGNMGSTSCEMLAKRLAQHFVCSYVEVTEDGENGACFEWERV